MNILKDFEDISQSIKDNITISLHKVWQEEFEANENEYEKIKNRINVLGFKMPNSLMVDAVKYSCYADKKNHATINYNGDVYKCTARDFNKDNVEGTIDDLGNIIWNSRNDYRNETRLLNKPCKECFLLPMCAGGCSQHALEHGLRNKEYCVHDFNEENKKQFVLEYLESVLQ
ncbi:SPASM domain-containing protein [Elizabethkingia occulta]